MDGRVQVAGRRVGEPSDDGRDWSTYTAETSAIELSAGLCETKGRWEGHDGLGGARKKVDQGMMRTDSSVRLGTPTAIDAV